MSLTHALKWSFLGELVAKAIQPVVFIVLVRLLTPADYGVMFSALMVISFSQIFWEAGMGKALIQRQTDVEDAANAAFWINIGLGVVIATILYLVASPVALIFFHDERVSAVLHVMTIQVFLGAVSAVHTALLQKDMSFQKLFWVQFATVSLPGLASIPLAMNGMGYWALVAGALVGQLFQVIMLWRMSHWRPQFTFNIKVAKVLVRFGSWVGLSGLLSWFYIWADSLIVGMYLGSHDLGLYRTGSQFVTMVFALLFGPIIAVLYSHLSRMHQDKGRLGVAIEKVIKVLILISIPIGFIIFSLSEPIGLLLFSKKWYGISFVIGAMALMNSFGWIVGMNGEFYRALGKPAYESIITGITLIVYGFVYYLAIKQSFKIFILARFTLSIGALILHFIVLCKVFPIGLGSIIRYLGLSTILVSVMIKITQYMISTVFTNVWLHLILSLVLNLLFVGITIYLVERKGLIHELINKIKIESKE